MRSSPRWPDFVSESLTRDTSFAAHLDVAFELEPHQIRSRSPFECGSTRSSPGGLGNIGRGLGRANPSPVITSRKIRACSRAMSAWSDPSAGA